MEEKEFKEFCWSRAAPSIRPFIKLALQAAEALNIEYSMVNVNRVVQLAGILTDAVKDSGAEKVPGILLELNPEGIIQSDMLLKEISPAILELRRFLFKMESPPFLNDIDKAIGWLDEVTRKQALELNQNPSQLTLLEFKKTVGRTIPLYLKRKMRRMLGHRLNLVVELLTLEYRTSDGQIKHARIIRDTNLDVMRQTLLSLANDTNFPFELLLMFLLTGVQPIIPPLRIRTTIRKSTTVKVDFRQRVSHKELLKLHQVLKTNFRRGRKSLTPERLEIYQLINDKGGIPMKGKKAFWIQLCGVWNHDHPEKKFKSPDCLRVAYRRIVDSRKGTMAY